jgi:hypothetical protein
MENPAPVGRVERSSGWDRIGNRPWMRPKGARHSPTRTTPASSGPGPILKAKSPRVKAKGWGAVARVGPTHEWH